MNNNKIITQFNELYNEYKKASRERKTEIQKQVVQLLKDVPVGTSMYRVGKETSSGWTPFSSYSSERAKIDEYIKTGENEWKMYGRTKKDIEDAMLGILYNSGEFLNKEQAEARCEKAKEDDVDYHRDIVNVDSRNKIGISNNRVNYPNRKVEESSTHNEFGLKEICPKCGGKNITFRDGTEYEDYYEAEAYCNDCKEVIDSTEVSYSDLYEGKHLKTELFSPDRCAKCSMQLEEDEGIWDEGQHYCDKCWEEKETQFLNENKLIESMYYCKCFNDEGDEINYIEFDDENEAVEWAEKSIKQEPKYNEIGVYTSNNNECLYLYDKDSLEESRLTESLKDNLNDTEDMAADESLWEIRECGTTDIGKIKKIVYDVCYKFNEGNAEPEYEDEEFYEEEADFNTVLKYVLSELNLSESKLTEDKEEEYAIEFNGIKRKVYSKDTLEQWQAIKREISHLEKYVKGIFLGIGNDTMEVSFGDPKNNLNDTMFKVSFDSNLYGKVKRVSTTFSNTEVNETFVYLANELYKLKK